MIFLWSEITIVKQSQWHATSYKWLEFATSIRIGILLTIIIAGSKTSIANHPLGNQTCDLALHILAMVSDFVTIGLVFLAVSSPWCSGWVVDCMHRYLCCGGCLSRGLGWTRPTTCAPFAQTTVSHGLNYSTALPVSTNFFLSDVCKSATFA